jgi:hypothetical protein
VSLRLPFSATRVIKASRSLTLAEKFVWIEDHGLDGTEGAWISHDNLAERLAMTAGSIHVIRKRLQALELHASIARPGARTRGWHALLPATCVPSTKPSPTEVKLLAGILDDHIERMKYRHQHGKQLVMDITTRRQRRLLAPSNGQQPHKESSGVEVGAEDGGSRPSGSVREHPPTSRRQDGEEGVFAHANQRSHDGRLTRISESAELRRFAARAQ